MSNRQFTLSSVQLWMQSPEAEGGNSEFAKQTAPAGRMATEVDEKSEGKVARQVVERSGWDELPKSARISWRHHLEREQITRRATKTFETATIVISALIPAMAAFGLDAPLLGLAGAVVAVLTGINTRNQFRESWLRHNRTLLAIQAEFVKFAYGMAPYSGQTSDRAGRLALNVEDIVRTDAILWNEREMKISPTRSEPTEEHFPSWRSAQHPLLHSARAREPNLRRPNYRGSAVSQA